MDNAKGRLQELLQGRGLPVPHYQVTSSGPPDYPVVQCTVTVSYGGGRKLSERVERRGGKKKAVEKLAAEKMLSTLKNEGDRRERSPRRHISLSPPPHVMERSSPERPSPRSSPSELSPVAILQERLQATRLSPPTYREDRVAIGGFRVLCRVAGGELLPDLLAEGEGRSKRTAREAAAREMLRKMDLRNSADPPGVGDHSEPVAPNPPGVGDQELESAKLLSLSPEYHYWHNLEEQVVCCLANVEGVVGVAYPITGHGCGDTKAVARQQANKTLLANFDTITKSK